MEVYMIHTWNIFLPFLYLKEQKTQHQEELLKKQLEEALQEVSSIKLELIGIVKETIIKATRHWIYSVINVVYKHCDIECLCMHKIDLHLWICFQRP